MNLTFTTNSPSNCSAGLSYSGVILTIEHRLIDEAKNPVTEWNFLEKIVMDPTGVVD